ncbi:MAG: TonB-dependent receptor [Planctomycetota bacterium]
MGNQRWILACLVWGAVVLANGAESPAGAVKGGIQSLNPDISVVVDTYAHTRGGGPTITDVLSDVQGFGGCHHAGHTHADIENGFGLKHAELWLAATVDPYFKGWLTTGLGPEEGAEVEEAVIQATSLPAGLGLKLGRLKSEFGRINAQHSHAWDFTDGPLVNGLLFGDHGINENGAILSWLAPLPQYLVVGVEGYQGGNGHMFAYSGEGSLPRRSGPRLGVGWVKFGPELPGRHSVLFGMSYGRGTHQEAHDGNEDGTEDHWLDGDSSFWGLDAVYKFNHTAPLGHRDVTIQAEYLARRRDLAVEDHLLDPSLIGSHRVDEQDGFYVQGTYGFAPRWRAGMRWDVAGLRNTVGTPDGVFTEYPAARRESVMVDFTPTEFSRLRVEVSHGRYPLDTGRESVYEAWLQCVVSIGAHGAHSY